MTTLLLWQILASVDGAFVIEAILKVWTQGSFPTLLRSTAHVAIIVVARVLAALLAFDHPAAGRRHPVRADRHARPPDAAGAGF